MTMTANELEIAAQERIDYLKNEKREFGTAEIFNELLVRYKAARIQANNYRKALEALEHAK